MPNNDIYGDGNAPINGQQIGVTLNKILGSVNQGFGSGGTPPPGSSDLTVNTTTGAITGPVTAAEFADGNSLQISSAFLTQLNTGGLTTPGNVVFEGDSLTTDVSPPSGAGNDWPQQFQARPFFQGTYTNVATAGNNLAAITSQYAAQVHPLSPAVTGNPATLFIWAGANDIGSTTAAAFMTAIRAYWALAKADGFRVVAFTITPRDTAGGNTAAVEAVRKSINTQIWNDLGTLYDSLIDVAQMFPDPNNTDNYSDALHLTASANKRLSAAVQYILQNQQFQSGVDINNQKIYNPNIIGGTGSFTTGLSLTSANPFLSCIVSTGNADAAFVSRVIALGSTRQVLWSQEGTTGDAIINIYDGSAFVKAFRINISTKDTTLGFGNLIFGTSGKGIKGTTTNDNADALNVGQIVSSLVATGSAVSLSSATGTNVTSISLTAGDWDVEGNVSFTLTGATSTAFSAGITVTSATVPTDGSECYSGVVTTVLTGVNGITLPRKRISIAATTTVYLVASSTFSVGTEAVFGAITARRVR